MKNNILLSALATLLLAGCATPVQTVFVAPDGSDANPGTKGRPFATLPRALSSARDLRKAELLSGPVTVYLRGGTYAVREPIVFTPDDSGTSNAPLTVASYPGEQAVLSGGVRLGGTWTRTPGKPYWQLEVPRARENGWVFYSLFVNGRSRERARFPNWGEKVLRAEGREPGGDPRQALRYFAGDVNPDWSNPTDIDVVLLCSWTPTIHRIREIAPERRAVRFFSAHVRPVDAWERNFRYYLSNVFEALDQPGEWYLNRRTGTLYYYPLPGEELNAAEVVAPVLRSRMVTFEGDPEGGRFIGHLHFRGLAFRHLDGDMDKHNGVYRQGHMFLTSAVVARGLRHASFERCEFAQLGEYALELADGCRDVTVRQCHLWDLGAGALQLGVTDLGTLLGKQKPEAGSRKPGAAPSASDLADNPRFVTGLVVDNCCIHRLGTIWHGCYGIVNRFASCSRITHNEIYDTHWDAIGLDARWSWKGEKFSSGTVVAYNHLHHLGLRYHTDAAGIYQFGPLDTHIHHNLIHDTVAYPYICGFAGIYLDEQSRGAVVENNLVYNNEWFAYFQHKGTDNLFRNNIGAFARDGFLGRGSLNETWKTNYLEASRNLYISSNAVAIRSGWQPGLRPPVLTRNLYHTLATNTLTFAGKGFAAWQAEGHDTGSVIADPGCRDPAAFDFTLGPDAPARRLTGFTPFDAEIRKAGLYGDGAWRATASRHPARTPSAVWSEEDFRKLGNAFRLDFNLMKPGDMPDVFRVTDQKGAGFAVTREVAGTAGGHCLKASDKPGLSQSFYPYMHLAPRALKSGRVTFSFALRQPERGAASCIVEFRGAGQTGTGPSIAVGRDGAIRANGKPAGTLAPGAWTRFEIAFTLGANRTDGYTLGIRGPGGEKTLSLPFGKKTFEQVGWLGVILPDNADGCLYLDAIALTVDES
ncbi:MAG: right-handed parallel beta-helix repeat-containing protein [Kiritimatiellia bacterium]|jgi:hypothetical protein|nr:right-handed parallel beta-helix repeat-containing protein [Kiritimatiellia bacterium]